jgi:hypothetical protein
VTPTARALKAIRLAFKERAPGLDAFLRPDESVAVFVNYTKAGRAVVEIKPIASEQVDLTEMLV